MVIRVGIIGLSEGNGHPFSFSAIVNGYDAQAFSKANWPVIEGYLAKQPSEMFGFPGIRITHAWTQDPEITARLCAACRIDTAVAEVNDMLGEIDALVIARDDWECHAGMAIPFLERGIPVFVDKPLSLDPTELQVFLPHLEAGRLMSTSGLRYAAELDHLRDAVGELGPIRLISATVLNGIERYGIHMLDAVSGLDLGAPVEIVRLPASYQAYSMRMDNGSTMVLSCLGAVAKTFHISLFGDGGHVHANLHDNFTAFRRTLTNFFDMLSSGKPPIPPRQVMQTMNLIRTAVNLEPGETRELAHG